MGRLTGTARNISSANPLTYIITAQGIGMKMITIGHIFALALLAAATGTAQAADTTGCTPQEQQQANQNKMSQNKTGVICPPDVDPSIKAPTPKTGDAPVIPPPGSPGGNPRVQPK